MKVGFKSDTGQKRSNNEDACFVLPMENIFLVADGVGGGNAGEIASRTTVSEFANYITNNPIENVTNKYAVVNYFQDCIDKVNTKIYEMAIRYTENKGMATTLSALYSKSGLAYIANVGDSRVYLYRDGALVQVTEDHTYVNTLVKAGIISVEEAKTHEKKNIITKAVGADKTIEPDFFQVEIMKDDIFVLCTDGLYDEVCEEDIINVLNKDLSMSEVCDELIDLANNNGGNDNITVISLKVTEEDINEQ
ncbi:MAG: Stp1/IreP family PP2C-type Ser/Thr phosphatase [Firmicutes bacterium]|nr:Stp1/IreP family PP2C-type Ser/Thr phosphatase [Bacillota bacterium]